MNKKWVWSSGHLVDVSSFPEEVGVIHSTKIKDEDKRLIDTSPEMFDALVWLLDEYLTGMDRGDGVEDNEAVTEAERVIAKARGE